MSKQPKTVPPTERALTVRKYSESETDERAIARAALLPTVNAATTARKFLPLNEAQDLNALVEELSEQCAKASAGDLTRVEGMLTAQAHTLDAIFGSLARRSALNLGQYPEAAERYMRLALKAQSQCRATLETLAMIKNPPTVIARQANIAHGPQQVNNGELPRARESQVQQSKLLEQTHGEWLDSGAPGEAIGSYQAMATVGVVDGAANRRR